MFILNNKQSEIMMAWLKKNGLCNNGNEEYQLYTINHKQAFAAVQLALNGEVTYSGLQHDTDKLFLYGIMDKKEASRIHRKYANHHIENCVGERDYEDCIIDYECARFTKADKPLNAYNTVMEYCKDKYEILLPTLQKFRLNSSIDNDINFATWNHINNYMAEYIMQQSIATIQRLKSRLSSENIENIIREYYSEYKKG